MVISSKMTMDDVKPEARYAVERWLIMSDPPYKRRFFLFFDHSQGHASATPPSPSRLPEIKSPGSKKSREKALLLEQEKELERANWNTTYNLTSKSATINTSPAKSKGRESRVLLQLMHEIIKPSSQHKVKALAAEANDAELVDLTTLMRSLSITNEQMKTSFSSEYVVQYVPKQAVPNGASFEDARASALGVPVTWAPPKNVQRYVSAPERTPPTPQMTKPAPKPKPQSGLLAWPGGGESNSSYRHFFKKLGEVYPSVVPQKDALSFSCGRTVPDSLVGDEFRRNPVLLPCETESRHMLKQRAPHAQPSWHLLYKDGVVYTDGGGKHHPGDRTVYMSDFTHASTVVKQARPNLDPFGSSITISMSDHPYLSTTYQTGICHSATMQYDRHLV